MNSLNLMTPAQLNEFRNKIATSQTHALQTQMTDDGMREAMKSTAIEEGLSYEDTLASIAVDCADALMKQLEK